MYGCYTRTREGTNATRYIFQEQVSLFGCKNGFIPWLLQQKLAQGQGEPFKWHVDLISELSEHPNYLHCTLLIDLKPKQNKTNLSLYEVIDVWGYSSDGWSPILLRLNGLFVDKEEPLDVDRNNFIRKDDDIVGPIYEFLYLDGSVSDGKLAGSWRPPPASPTNAALLWPDSLKYFVQCIRSRTPNVL